MKLPNVSLPNIAGLPGASALASAAKRGAAPAAPTADSMMCLGDFVFELKSAPYQTRNDDWSWRHAESARVGAPPATQFAGKDADKLKLSGELYPGLTGGAVKLGELREMADAGDAYTLIDGQFHNLGEYVIEKISVTRTDFLPNGTARRIEFSIELKRVQDEAPQPDSGAASMANTAASAQGLAASATASLGAALSGGLPSLLPGSLPDLAGGALNALGAVEGKLSSVAAVAACAAGAKAAIGAGAAEIRSAITGAMAAAAKLPVATVAAAIGADTAAAAVTAAANAAVKATKGVLKW
jgi:phage protein U